MGGNTLIVLNRIYIHINTHIYISNIFRIRTRIRQKHQSEKKRNMQHKTTMDITETNMNATAFTLFLHVGKSNVSYPMVIQKRPVCTSCTHPVNDTCHLYVSICIEKFGSHINPIERVVSNGDPKKKSKFQLPADSVDSRGKSSVGTTGASGTCAASWRSNKSTAVCITRSAS